MRRHLLIAALVLPLGGCAWLGGTPTQAGKTTLVETFVDACKAYDTALNLAADALDAKLLSEAQVDAIDKARVGGNSVCEGPQPADLTSAFVTVAVATAQIAAAYQGGN